MTINCCSVCGKKFDKFKFSIELSISGFYLSKSASYPVSNLNHTRVELMCEECYKNFLDKIDELNN